MYVPATVGSLCPNVADQFRVYQWYGPFICWATPITVASHAHHGVSYRRQHDCLLKNLFRLTTHETSAVLVLCEEITGHQWIPLKMDQQLGTRFDVIT